MYRSVSACADERGGSPSEINGGSRGRGHRKAGYPAAISDASFLFSVRKKKTSLSASSKRERESERKKKITAQLINSSTLFFFHFLFLRPRAALCCWREQPRNIISDLCACNNQRAHPLNPQQLLCMLNRQMQPTCHY